jgi:peptidoglycan hydrolase-like protein with peptidoglycan-binding domain
VTAAARGSGRSGPHTKSHSTSHVAASSHSKPSTTAAAHNGKSKYASSRKPGTKKTTARGQQKIDSERAQAIQEALIREHYLSGEPAGTWNESSEAAMRRYQADHGWQSKVVPDSRALISLGLGPSHDHLLNPESAMTTEPAAPHAESLTPVSHSADPGTRVNTTPLAPVSTTPPEDSSKPQ